MKNLKKLSRNDLRRLTGGSGDNVCGMTCSSGQVISMHHCSSCEPLSGGAGMGCVYDSVIDLGDKRAPNMIVQTC
ncbi:bacteriocin-like protein [Chryseobacterium sp. Leaf201]|uniref:bacteriocin-like protein n=1 Tax=Chryseobacterium sp. Leaf201 TaxID=1735672 RepID=UPI000AB30018|nr:hypothetical protein [Chryseobacterium sp. Leaf201]